MEVRRLIVKVFTILILSQVSEGVNCQIVRRVDIKMHYGDTLFEFLHCLVGFI